MFNAMRLSTKISASVSLFLFIALLLSTAAFIMQAYINFKSEVRKEAENSLIIFQAVHIQSMLNRGSTLDNDPAIATMDGALKQLRKNQDRFVLWATMAPKVIAFQQLKGMEDNEPPRDDIDREALLTGMVVGRMLEADTFRLTVPVILGQGDAANEKCFECHGKQMGIEKGEVIGAYSIALSVKGLWTNFLDLAKEAVFISVLVSILVSVISILLLNRMVSGPISRMIRVMRDLAWGNHQIEITDLDREDEIGDMAKKIQVFKDSAIKRRSAEEMLQKLSQAIEQSPSAVFITDTDGSIEYVNSRFTGLTGYTAEEAIGENPRILKSSDTPKEVHAEIWRTIQSGNEWRGELKDTHKNGNHFWINAIIAPIKDDVGTITHYIATHDDISQRKDAEFAVQYSLEQADIANRAKSELMANMSHELRTPLNAIIGFSSTIKEETFGPIGNEKYREYIGDIADSGQHLLELIGDILDVSAIEAGKLKLHEEPVEIGSMVSASVRMVQNRADQGNVHLRIDIDDDLPQIYADKRRLKQILLNILTNAVKFTRAEGMVSLHASLAGDGGFIFTVADTGIGMDRAELAKAMTQFGQVDRGIASKHEGTGLGLPLTLGLVEAQQGVMKMQSKKGKGTTVEIKFPRERAVTGHA